MLQLTATQASALSAISGIGTILAAILAVFLSVVTHWSGQEVKRHEGLAKAASDERLAAAEAVAKGVSDRTAPRRLSAETVTALGRLATIGLERLQIQVIDADAETLALAKQIHDAVQAGGTVTWSYPIRMSSTALDRPTGIAVSRYFPEVTDALVAAFQQSAIPVRRGDLVDTKEGPTIAIYPKPSE